MEWEACSTPITEKPPIGSEAQTRDLQIATQDFYELSYPEKHDCSNAGTILFRSHEAPEG